MADKHYQDQAPRSQSKALRIKSTVANPKEEDGVIAGLEHFVTTLNPKIDNGLYQKIKNDYPDMQFTLDYAQINAGRILQTLRKAREFAAKKKSITPDAVREEKDEAERVAGSLAQVPTLADTMFKALAALELHANESFDITQSSLRSAAPDGFKQRDRGAVTQTTLGEELRPEVRLAFTSDFEYLQAVRDLGQFRTGEIKTSPVSMKPMIVDMAKKLTGRVQGDITPD